MKLTNILKTFLNEDPKIKKTAKVLSQKDLDTLVDSFNKIAGKYSRYLSVFYYFDPNSLGTISEVLLTKLLNDEGNIQAQHTGASGGLADLVVNGIPISLKTTASDAPIGLGSDEVEVPKGDVRDVATALAAIKGKGGNTFVYTISELERKGKNKTVYAKIRKRITSIANKLAGPDNAEVFVWAEKRYTKGILNGIYIHVRKFDRQSLIDLFMNSHLYITDKAWGIKTNDGKILVTADNSGKALNVTPQFIYLTSESDPIKIELPVPSISGDFLNQVRKDIPTRLFNALDDIHTAIFGSSKK